tara:strand:+ start:1353 stop:2330 length:978 start_codon:yes stop_codon:yes gene_type:complete
MGIKNLNKYLLDKCNKTSIQKIHLSKISGKTIVIDTSIYLYQFVSMNALLENMYLMISLLKNYDITPIFIFDGKPPPEKNELLMKRSYDKKDAEGKYKLLQNKLENETDRSLHKQIINEMDSLKRQFVRVYSDDITRVKKLMKAYGVMYYDAIREADELCAYLTNKKDLWGCMSDDMDMFLYGCKVILRNLSLKNHTIMIYNTNDILNDLEMDPHDFCEVMVLSGTDYNITCDTNLFETMKWYTEYKIYTKQQEQSHDKSIDFYIWLLKKTKYIKDYGLLLKAYRMFQGELFDDYANSVFEVSKQIKFDMDIVNEIMKDDGFIIS